MQVKVYLFWTAYIIVAVVADLHDIGKKLVVMMFEGNVFKVIDPGADVSAEKYIEALNENPGAVAGWFALLEIIMANMEEITQDNYTPDTPGVVEFLNWKIA